MTDLTCHYRQTLRKLVEQEGHKWSPEKLKAANNHLNAWDKWAEQSNLKIRLTRIPVFFVLTLFPIWLIAVFLMDRRCEKLYQDLQLKINTFNELSKG